MNMPIRRGPYAITSAELTPGLRLFEAVTAAVTGGVTLVQYRDKGADRARQRAEVQRLVEICHSAGVPLIVNDDIRLARETAAAGVHLGRDDGGTGAAREMLGPDAIIGVSCYDSLELAVEAERSGADYVAFGSFFPSPTKPDAVRPSPGLLTDAKVRLSLPVVAIGGITVENGRSLVSAGADLLAVITGLFGAGDVRAAAEDFAKLF